MIFEEFNVNLFIFTIFSAIGMVAMALVRQIRLVMGRNAATALEARNEKLKRRHDQLVKDHEAQQQKIREAEDERRMILGQIQEFRRRAKLAAQDNFEIIHEVGEPVGNQRPFTGPLGLGFTLSIAKNVTTESKLRGVRHTLEVWADNQVDALRAAKLAFPADNGFIVNGLQPASQMKPASSAAAE